MSNQQPSSITNKTTTEKNEYQMTLEQAFNYGVSLYQHNKRQQAREVFEEIAAKAKNFIAALQVLAVMDNEEGHWQQALKRLNRALEIEPNNHSLLFDKATILTAQNFNKDAKLIVDNLLKVAPNNAQLLELKQQLTNTLSKKNKPIIRAQIDNDQSKGEIKKTLIVAQKMFDEGNHEQATILFQTVLAFSPNQIQAILGLAKIQIKNEQFALAKQTLLRAYKPQKSVKELLVLLAHCEIHSKQFKQARPYCHQGIKQFHNEAIFYQMLILSYEKAENWKEAYQYGEQFILLFPENQDLLHRFATASFMQLKARHNFTIKAILACQKHILNAMKKADKKNHALLCTYLGEILLYKGEAIKSKILLEGYIANHPTDLDAAFNISFVYRTLKEWEQFYRSNEIGLDCSSRLHYRGDLPRWDLSRPKNDIVLIMPEQGVGDELQYFHNLNLVLENAKKVYIACDVRLEKILNQAFAHIHVIPIKRRTEGKIDIPESVINEITSWIAGGSLAKICYQHFARHFYQNSYITPTKSNLKKTQQYLFKLKKAHPNKKLVGICWRSGLASASRNIHYLATEEVAYLIKQFDDTLFINLQYGDCNKELRKIKKIANTDIHQISSINLRDDFETTAALIANLDAVITAGTAVHRLSAAVGTNCHVFFAATEKSDFTQPQTLFSPQETGYFYPPMLENKYPMLDVIATNLQQQLTKKTPNKEE